MTRRHANEIGTVALRLRRTVHRGRNPPLSKFSTPTFLESHVGSHFRDQGFCSSRRGLTCPNSGSPGANPDGMRGLRSRLCAVSFPPERRRSEAALQRPCGPRPGGPPNRRPRPRFRLAGLAACRAGNTKLSGVKLPARNATASGLLRAVQALLRFGVRLRLYDLTRLL